MLKVRLLVQKQISLPSSPTKPHESIYTPYSRLAPVLTQNISKIGITMKLLCQPCGMIALYVFCESLRTMNHILVFSKHIAERMLDRVITDVAILKKLARKTSHLSDPIIYWKF